MLTPSSLRNVPKSLTACALLVLAGAFANAQNPGGPPASIVFFSAGNGQPNNQIYTMNPDGTNPVRVTFDTASDVDPDISPNGKYIVFTSNQTGDNDIYIMDCRSGTTLDLTNNPQTTSGLDSRLMASRSSSTATVTAVSSKSSS